MSNVSDLKPWFREDIARTLVSIYFVASQTPPPSLSFDFGKDNASAQDGGYRKGFAAALASVALAVGINPETFLSPEDIQRLRKETR